jgi:hypothetical protein
MTNERQNENVPAAYTSGPRARVESSDALRARIPGWGADLDPRDRPSVPRLCPPGPSNSLPTRQAELVPRERSIEHSTLTPVFGTSCPPHGLSGFIRRLSYRRYSEARAAHWLLLLLADRVDSSLSTLGSIASTSPDNPIRETGIWAEFSRRGMRSRFGTKRADVKHQWMDPLIVAAPWAARIAVLTVIVRKIRGQARKLVA